MNGTNDKWAQIKDALKGFGQVPRQLDGLRLHLPNRLQKALPEQVNLPWMFSFWMIGCLRVVPLTLWDEYVVRVKSHFNSIDDFIELIAEGAQERTADKSHRWHIPVHLAQQAKIGDKAACMLTTREAWIEIWLASVKEDRLSKLTQCYEEKLKNPAASHALPMPPSSPPKIPNASL